MDLDLRKKVASDQNLNEPHSRQQSNFGLIKIIQSLRNLLHVKDLNSPGRILAILIGGIALAEVIAMIVVYFFQHLPYALQILLDAVVMTVIIFPLLYFLSFKPLLLYIQQRDQSERINQIRLDLMQFANTHTLDELLQFTLDKIETLTGSSIGFFHFLESDQKTLRLQAWSTNTLQNMCKAEGKDSHYDVEQAGVWADAVRLRQPILHNDYASLPNRKGMPSGHALVVREMAVPILRDSQVMAILGIGNKPRDYTANDVEVVSTLADFAWDVVEHKRADIALHNSEEKFRTLVDWTYDWELWLDPRGNIVFTNRSSERITGYTPEELIANPGLLASMVHPDDEPHFKAHHQMIHNKSNGPIRIEYRIISRDGSDHWIEHGCRPVYGSENRYLGRRISNRDITDRKKTEQEIRDYNQKEAMLIQSLRTQRTEIARDLHDTLGQNISFLRMNLEHLSEVELSRQANLQTQIQSMAKAANESYDLIRAMLSLLQSVDSVDPLILFSKYAEQVAERSSYPIDLTYQGNPKQVSSQQVRQLFFIFREALNNIEKFAHPSRVSGEFKWFEDALELVISDDGCGFDLGQVQSNGHYGLRFMRERAELVDGSLTIQSEVGKGTKITVRIPYEKGLPARSS